MRLRERDLKTVYLKKHQVSQDDESNDIVGYDNKPIELEMTVQAAGGQVAATMYGQRLKYIKSCKYQGDELVEGKNEHDGICLKVPKESEPDYQISSIQTFKTHLNVTLERIKQNGSTD